MRNARAWALRFLAFLASTASACSGDDVGATRPNDQSGTGGCRDYVTSDGFWCCCGRPTCSREPRCPSTTEGNGGSRAGSFTGGTPSTSGGTDGSGGAQNGGGGIGGSLILDAGRLEDGGSIVLDPSCPKVNLNLMVPSCYLNGPCVYEPYLLTLLGCCLPDDRCGASTRPFPTFSGPPPQPPTPPAMCASYDQFAKYYVTQPDARASCHYPHDGGANDAAVVSTDARTDSDGNVGD